MAKATLHIARFSDKASRSRSLATAIRALSYQRFLICQQWSRSYVVVLNRSRCQLSGYQDIFSTVERHPGSVSEPPPCDRDMQANAIDHQAMVSLEADVSDSFVSHIQEASPKFIADRDVVDLIRCMLPINWDPIDLAPRNHLGEDVGETKGSVQFRGVRVTVC